jgi:7,8-dihydropterin-6-yl-methyl-4-(beta-D-ribofuranosyl)aminobenzene 5'-phosphate synthase
MKNLLLFCFALTFSCPISAQKPTDEGTITNLYDAFGKERAGLVMDFGFSCIIKYKGKTILFDSGSNADTFEQNVRTLGVDLSKVDIAIASHSHFDHINGFDYLLKVNPKVKIYYPNDIFWGADVPYDATGQEAAVQDSLPKEMRYFGGQKTKFSIHQSGRFWKANIEYVKENQEILPGVKLVATASPFMGYFSRYPNMSFAPGVFKDNQPNQANPPSNESKLPELSLSLATDQGEILVVGCSHSSVEKIVEAAKAYTQQPIKLVYGGYHLLPFKRTDLLALAKYLKTDLGVKKVAPAHCTGHLAFKLLKEAFGDSYVFAGLGETIRY